MVKKADIYKAIFKTLKENFKNIKTLSTDIEEGIKRPSFFVELDNNKVRTYNTTSREVNATIRIYYYASNATKNKKENAEILDNLEEVFLGNYFIKEGFCIYIEETESVIVDKVLQFSFDFTYIEELDKNDTTENMESLNMKGLIIDEIGLT